MLVLLVFLRNAVEELGINVLPFVLKTYCWFLPRQGSTQAPYSGSNQPFLAFTVSFLLGDLG
jgi:hypothetical protein